MDVKETNQITREYINTFRMKYEKEKNGDMVYIDFGEFTQDKSVNIKSSICFPITILKDLAFRAVLLGNIYQKQTGEYIGFPRDTEDNG